MANENWWEAAPLVEETVAPSENWWEAAPLLEQDAEDQVIETPPLPEAKLDDTTYTDYNATPSINMAVAKFEDINNPESRAYTHNQYGAHIVPSNPELAKHLQDNFGMVAGEPFEKDPNLMTALYPTTTQGKEASDFLISKIWDDNGGNVEDFVEQYTGITDRDSLIYQNYVAEIKNNLRSNEPGGINSAISEEIYSKYPFLPKVGIHGTSGYVNPYGVGTPLEYFPDDEGGRVEFDLDKATETDVVLDILHAIPDGKDLMLRQKYEKFASKIAEDRADDIQFFYQEALKDDPDIPEDEFVRNYIDSQLRAVLATTMGGSGDPNYEIDYADIEKLSPDSIKNGEDILQYIKGYGSDRAGAVRDEEFKAEPLSTAYRQQGIDIEKPEEVMKAVARSRIDSGNFATHDLGTNAASLAEAYHDPNAN